MNYTQEDYIKLKNLLATFENLENHLGDYVEVDYLSRIDNGISGYVPMHLCGVEKFVSVSIGETIENAKTINFTSRDGVIKNIKDFNGQVLYQTTAMPLKRPTGKAEDFFGIRRKMFGNIIADIEEDFFSKNKTHIFDRSKVDYVRALDY
jgi:hypothetical protein